MLVADAGARLDDGQPLIGEEEGAGGHADDAGRTVVAASGWKEAWVSRGMVLGSEKGSVPRKGIGATAGHIAVKQIAHMPLPTGI